MLKINYNCPCCKYSYQEAYEPEEPLGGGERITGDEPPVRIVPKHAELVIPAVNYWDKDQKVELVGCPKCKSVTFNDSIW